MNDYQYVFVWGIILGVIIGAILTGFFSYVFAEEVSCQFLESNGLGKYMVSYIPGGEYELRSDYYLQAQQCNLWWNNVEEDKGWFNW